MDNVSEGPDTTSNPEATRKRRPIRYVPEIPDGEGIPPAEDDDDE